MNRVVRSRTGRFTASFVAVIAVVGGVAYGAQVATKSESATLPADGTTHTVTAKCPNGANATAGGIRLSDDVDDYVQGTYPTGQGKWTAAGFRYPLQPDAEFTAFARCMTGAKTSTEDKTKPLADSETIVKAKCPKGTVVSGGGAQLADDAGDYASGSFPSGQREWTAVGHGSSDLTAQARCLKGEDVTQKSKHTDLLGDAQTHEVTAKCPNDPCM